MRLRFGGVAGTFSSGEDTVYFYQNLWVGSPFILGRGGEGRGGARFS